MPTILRPCVRIPSTLSTLFPILNFICHCKEEKDENNVKEAGFGPYKNISLNNASFYGLCNFGLIKRLFDFLMYYKFSSKLVFCI